MTLHASSIVCMIDIYIIGSFLCVELKVALDKSHVSALNLWFQVAHNLFTQKN